MNEKKKTITLYGCPGCGALYTSPKETCLNCAMVFDTEGEERGLRVKEMPFDEYNRLIEEFGRDLGFVFCSCSGDHCPQCVVNAI